LASKLSEENKDLEKIFDKELRKLRLEQGANFNEMFQKIITGVYIVSGKVVVSMSMDGDNIKVSFAKDGKVINTTINSLLQ